ncbi:hypothetical protein D3C76_1069360 [compost metagenome]
MSESAIEAWIDNLGSEYEDMLERGLVPLICPKQLYAGSDSFYLECVTGIYMTFSDATNRFEALFITLKKAAPSIIEYAGELPNPYHHHMTQTSVREMFGEPFEKQPPVKTPYPIGEVGGWESYIPYSASKANVKVVFQYAADMQVTTLVFAGQKRPLENILH